MQYCLPLGQRHVILRILKALSKIARPTECLFFILWAFFASVMSHSVAIFFTSISSSNSILVFWFFCWSKVQNFSTTGCIVINLLNRYISQNSFPLILSCLVESEILGSKLFPLIILKADHYCFLVADVANEKFCYHSWSFSFLTNWSYVLLWRFWDFFFLFLRFPNIVFVDFPSSLLLPMIWWNFFYVMNVSSDLGMSFSPSRIFLVKGLDLFSNSDLSTDLSEEIMSRRQRGEYVQGLCLWVGKYNRSAYSRRKGGFGDPQRAGVWGVRPWFPECIIASPTFFMYLSNLERRWPGLWCSS